MQVHAVSDSELQLMHIVWDLGGRARFAQVMDVLEQNDSPWNKNTVLTFLARLVDKGLLSTEKFGRRNEYIAQVSQQDYQASQTQTLVEKVYWGSVKGLVASLLQSDFLSQQDLEELRQFWQEEKERQ